MSVSYNRAALPNTVTVGPAHHPQHVGTTMVNITAWPTLMSSLGCVSLVVACKCAGPLRPWSTTQLEKRRYPSASLCYDVCYGAAEAP